MESESYTVKTTGFEGPFRLLLELVEKRKLFINDVSLAAVTEDYLNYMNKLGGMSAQAGLNFADPAEISSFVVVASTLILIKSKSLLPNLSLTTEEEGDIKSLEERLRLFEIFTKLGGNVKNNFGKNMIFALEERKNETLIFLPDVQITRESMMGFAKKVLGSMPQKAHMPQVDVRKVVSIEEMISNLTERIQSSIKMSFKDLHGKISTREEKVTAIVGFLALLELVRNGILDAMQENGFEDIIISKNQVLEASD